MMNSGTDERYCETCTIGCSTCVEATSCATCASGFEYDSSGEGLCHLICIDACAEHSCDYVLDNCTECAHGYAFDASDIC